MIRWLEAVTDRAMRRSLVWFRQFFYVSECSNSEEIWTWGLAHSRVLRLWHDLVSSLIPSRQVQNIYFHGFSTASSIPTIAPQGISLFGHSFSNFCNALGHVWHGSGWLRLQPANLLFIHCSGASFLSPSHRQQLHRWSPKFWLLRLREQYPSYIERKKQEREIRLRATVFCSDLHSDCQA